MSRSRVQVAVVEIAHGIREVHGHLAPFRARIVVADNDDRAVRERHLGKRYGVLGVETAESRQVLGRVGGARRIHRENFRLFVALAGGDESTEAMLGNGGQGSRAETVTTGRRIHDVVARDRLQVLIETDTRDSEVVLVVYERRERPIGVLDEAGAVG